MIEALVAMVVLSFGLYGAAELVTASRTNGQMASWRAEAAGAAALKVEELRLAAPLLSDLLKQNAATTTTLVIPATKQEKILPQNKRLSWTATISRATDDPGRLDIRVDVVRTARPDTDLPLTAQGSAFLPGWPAAPGGSL
jgi:Tfp pilus assembly protein PilV